jgi:hypothetical protein
MEARDLPLYEHDAVFLLLDGAFHVAHPLMMRFAKYFSAKFVWRCTSVFDLKAGMSESLCGAAVQSQATQDLRRPNIGWKVVIGHARARLTAYGVRLALSHAWELGLSSIQEPK